MARQLVLMDPDQVDWHLDEHTREVGRRGVAAARSALRQARSGHDEQGMAGS